MLAALFLLVAPPADPPPATGPFATFAEATAWVDRTARGPTRDRVDPHWIGGGPAFWYRVDLGEGAGEFVRVDPQQGARRRMFGSRNFLAALGKEAERLGRHPPAGFTVAGVADDGLVRVLTPEGSGYEFDPADGRLTVQERWLDWPSFGATRLTKPRASRQRASRDYLRFINLDGEPLSLYWMTPSGGEKFCTILLPHSPHWQRTRGGDVWVLRDPAGRLREVWEASGDPGQIIVRDASADPGAARTPVQAPEPRPPLTFELRDRALYAVPRSGAAERFAEDGVGFHKPLLRSPDGRTVAIVREPKGDPRTIPLIDPGPPGTVRPKLEALPYRKPGDPLPRPRPVLFDIATGARIDVPTDLMPNPYALSRWHWAPNSSELFVLDNERGHQTLRVLAIDRDAGTVRTVVEERSDTFIDYAAKTELHWLDRTGTLLWASERDGWNHLYRYNVATGEVVNQVTAGEWVVRDVERVDEEDGRVWFAASGVVPGQDPYFVHLCRVDLDGTNFTVLTSDGDEPGDGTHTWEFTPDRRFLIDRFSRVDLPPVTVLRDAETGRSVCELERADDAALRATGWTRPIRFTAKGRDGRTDIHGLLIFPPGCDPAVAADRHPVIEKIYAGPQDQHVPKAFGRQRDARELAALGFVVARIDGMGTNWRGKAFHDVCWKNLKDAGLPDRIAWLRAAAEEYPALDLSRMGIYGGSAGGQNALRAVLDHGDFYTAAAADCGCHDNRVDKLWWNELWMGHPVGPAPFDEHWAAGSNAVDAHKLTGDLLLTVGGLDRNVDPGSTMQVVDALIAADKDFDLIVFPRRGHGAGESDYGRRRRAEFFRRVLGP